MKHDTIQSKGGSLKGLSIPTRNGLAALKSGALAIESGENASLVCSDGNSWQQVTSLGVPDPFENDIALLMHFHGDDNSTQFIDDVGAVYEVARGTPVISTARGKFGKGSLRIGASNHGIRPNLNVYNPFILSNKTFTFECWVYLDSTGRQHRLMTNWVGGTATLCAFAFRIDYGQLAFSVGVGDNNQGYVDSSPLRVRAQEWTHVAWVREGRNLTYYVNGKKGGTSVLPVGNINNGTQAAIGYSHDSGSTGFGLIGNINELCMTFAARYTDDFEPRPIPYQYRKPA